MIYVTHLIKGCVEIQMYTIIKSLVQILISFLPLVIRRKIKIKNKKKEREVLLHSQHYLKSHSINILFYCTSTITS